MTDGRGCPVRDKMLVERTNPATPRCPVRDNICVEHVAYLTARPGSRVHPFSTDIASLTACCPVEKENEDFIFSAFPMNTITIKIDKYSDEWTKLKFFVHSLGLSMIESEPKARVRAGWAEAAKEMHQCGDNQLLFDDVFDNKIQI